jgi:predicted nucleic acid-binding protein
LLGFSVVEQELIDFVSLSNIYTLNNAVADKTIELRSKYKIKLPDAIIAATAIINQLDLISHNAKDFEKIIELKYIDSHSIH